MRDFLHAGGDSTRMPEIPPNAGGTGLSITPKGRVAGDARQLPGGLRPMISMVIRLLSEFEHRLGLFA